jgi:hypothetical protein
MADKKISALTAATTPLAGTEVLPIVQGGTTVKVSVDDLTTGKVVTTGPIISVGTGKDRLVIEPQNAGSGALLLGTNSAGNAYTPVLVDGSTTVIKVAGTEVARTNGNGIAPVAGKGIDFSANTHAAGMTSELLNDYEEGVWTGTLTGDAAAPTTPVTASGRYTRIGRQVTAQISLFNVNTTGASGVLLITGLPFSSSAERAYGSCFFIGMGSAVATAHIQSADNRISFLDAVTGAYINISAGAGKYVGASITYTV